MPPLLSGVVGNGVPLVDGRGALIVLEGLDRCGKSSQCASLTSFLEAKGIQVEALRFPDRTTNVGRMISSYLSSETEISDSAVHLLFSANRWEKKDWMQSKLQQGVTLVVDRYSYSGVAFSAAKGLDLEWCKQPETGLPAPDLVLYLDISAEAASERGEYGKERYEKLEFQRQVAVQYQLLRDPSWKEVDATQSVEAIQKIIRKEALKVIEACGVGRELRHLWCS